MDTAERQFLEALARVRHTEPAILAGLKARFERRKEGMLKVRELIDVGVQQGRAQELRELLDLIENADDHIAKARK